ncbi:MAG TPA: TMEM165/GDT1 family protein [Candidatus Saccharimonadales bacterium]|nr:TMEM165/GDT1 family protein [Candidatus Saccharimonadales bacterium]
MHLGIIAVVFGVIFIAELPDKSMFASLVLSTKYRAMYVWLGVCAAFFAHVLIAVIAGRLLTLLPHRTLEAVVAVLFLLGGLLMLFGRHGLEEEPKDKLGNKLTASFGKVFVTSFTVIFIGEWGDITQIATANYAAKYHDPVNVAIGATLGLWAVAGLAVASGDRLLARLPGRLIMRIAGLIFIGFAIFSAVAAWR